MSVAQPSVVVEALNGPSERDSLIEELNRRDTEPSDNVVEFLTATVRAGAITARYLIEAGLRPNASRAAIRVAYIMDDLWESLAQSRSTDSETLNWLDHSVATLAAFSPTLGEADRTVSEYVAPVTFLRYVSDPATSDGRSVAVLVEVGRVISERMNYRSAEYASRARLPWIAIQGLNSVETTEGFRGLARLAGTTGILDPYRILGLVDYSDELEMAVADWRETNADETNRRPASNQTPSKGSLQESPRKIADDRFTYFERLPAYRMEDDGGQITVWYGTDRARSRDQGSQGFDNSPTAPREVHYGRCIVNVPKAHKFGQTGNTWWSRVVRRAENSQLSLLENLPFDDAIAFTSSVDDFLSESNGDEHSAMVYVHGYNTSFEQAAIRAAQLGFDLHIDGVTAFYSWPSAARAHKYTHDVDNVEASEPQFAEFIETLATKTSITTVNFIVHSMGNRLAARTLNRLQEKLSKSGIRFGAIICAAPDINTHLFRNLAALYPLISASTTMYVSERDKALAAAHIVWDSPRAGFTPPVTVLDGVSTIEVSDVDVSRLGHGYYSAAHPVLYDIRSILDGIIDPNRRVRLRRAVSPDGQYWQLAP